MSGQLLLAAGLIVAAALVVLAGMLVLRRIVISRRGGVVECGLRHAPGQPWRHGLAEYRRAQLSWHRSMSLRLRPHAALDRGQFAVLDTRPAAAGEGARLGPGMVVVRCRALVRHRGRAADWRVLELALSQDAVMGLLSWLEASPVYPIRRASLGRFPSDRRRASIAGRRLAR